MKTFLLMLLVITANINAEANDTCEFLTRCRIKTTKCKGPYNWDINNTYFYFKTRFYFKFRDQFLCIDRNGFQYTKSLDKIERNEFGYSIRHHLKKYPIAPKDIPKKLVDEHFNNLMFECKDKKEDIEALYDICQ